MDGLFPSLDCFSGEISYGWGGGLLDFSVSPSPNPFPLDFGFRIWALDLRLGFGTGLELDNKEMFVRGLNC